MAAWNQLGCLSPHVIYVEQGGNIDAEGFADLLAGQLEALEKTHPRGRLTARGGWGSRRRLFGEVRAAYSPETKIWASAESTAWTVTGNRGAFPNFVFVRFVWCLRPNDVNASAMAPMRFAKAITCGGYRQRVAGGGIGAAIRPLGGAAHLPARRNAKAAAGLAARRTPGAGRFADLERVGKTITAKQRNLKMELRKTFQFEAAHLLPHLPKSHKCRRLHGHSFRVEIAVSGPCDPKLGW